MKRARTWLAALALATLTAGCGNNVVSVCEDLDDQCVDMPYNDCLGDGETLQRRAESSRCPEVFDAYLDCVAEAVCSWRKCTSERAALEGCVGPFSE
jgi:hypothetical protein